MSNIPLEIQLEIINKLPAKSLIRFRSVCKTWKSLIDSSDFIAKYSGKVPHLLVRYEYNVTERKYVSFIDDDTFPQHEESLTVLGSLLKYYDLIGCCDGLLCLFRECVNSLTGMAVIWNPSIRKDVAVVVHNMEDDIYKLVLGFGVCRETSDPKIVKIRYIYEWEDVEFISFIPSQVEVFTLSTGIWKSLKNNLPRKSIQFEYSQVVIDGIIYWLATDRNPINGEFESYNLIVSFDMTTEEFGEVNLPESLANRHHFCLSLFKLRESLVVVDYYKVVNNPVFDIWMLDVGVTKSFKKLFSIETPIDGSVMGFRTNGAPIVEILEDDRVQFVVYEPYLNYNDTIGNFGIDGFECSFCVFPYMETLLLLDQPKLTVYNDI